MGLKIDRRLVSDIGRVVVPVVLFTAMAMLLGRPEVREYLFDIRMMRATLGGGPGGFHSALSCFLFVVLWGGLIAAGLPRLWASAVGGIMYGAFAGTLLSLLASLLGASILFFAGSTMLADVVERRMGSSLSLWRKRFRENAFWWVLYARLFPFSNSTVMSLLCGSLRIPYRDFVRGSLIGFIPLAAAFAVFGSGGVQGNMRQIGFAAALLALSVFSRRLLGAGLHASAGNSGNQGRGS